MKIALIFRKKRKEYNSIETLFSYLAQHLPSHCQIETYELPYSGASPWVIIKNVWSFRKKINADLIHITGDVHYMALLPARNKILTIHDAGSLIKGNWLKKIYFKIFWLWLPSLFVKKITVISEFTKHEVTAYIPWATKKIQVVHNPCNQLFQRNEPTGRSDIPTLLQIGTKSNKNLEGVMEAIKDIPCHLIIIGKLTKEQKHTLNTYKIDYSNYFNIPQSQLIQLYHKAHILTYVSFYEGFGLPILEAQIAGIPVITTTKGGIPEVAQESVLYADPYNPESITNAVMQLIQDKNLRTEIIRKGYQNTKRFSIEKMAEEIANLYTAAIK